MTLVAGSVVVADDMSVVADGLAAYLWETEWSEKIQLAHDVLIEKYRAAGNEEFARRLKLEAMRSLALRCNKQATGVATWVVWNAEVEVTIGITDAGLQGLPQKKNEDEPTKAPLTPHVVKGVLK